MTSEHIPADLVWLVTRKLPGWYPRIVPECLQLRRQPQRPHRQATNGRRRAVLPGSPQLGEQALEKGMALFRNLWESIMLTKVNSMTATSTHRYTLASSHKLLLRIHLTL
jgi:hypothetical protein